MPAPVDDAEAKNGIERLAAILAEGSDDFNRIEQLRVLAECHFDLRRIRAARFDVFLTMGDLEDATANDFERAVRALVSMSRYQARAVSKTKRALRDAQG